MFQELFKILASMEFTIDFSFQFCIMVLSFVLRVVDIDKWQIKKNYSLITALNLLDRIDHPVKFVNQLRASVRDDGLVLLAIVLPYNPCYETGTFVDFLAVIIVCYIL